jgi:ribosomal protein S20
MKFALAHSSPKSFVQIKREMNESKVKTVRKFIESKASERANFNSIFMFLNAAYKTVHESKRRSIIEENVIRK